MKGSNVCEQSPSDIIFYPLFYESNILNGIGVITGYLCLSELLSIIELSYIKFIHEEIFFFQKKVSEGDQPFDYNKQLINNEKENILKHMVLKSKEIKEKEKKCLIFAIDSGFPCKSIIDFETKKLDNELLLHEWEKMTSIKGENLERDFIDTLSKGIKVIFDEYSNLFKILETVPKKNALPSLAILLTVMELPLFSPPKGVILPKIFFKKATIKIILRMDRESINKICDKVKKDLKIYGHNVRYYYSLMRINDESVYRAEITLDITFSKFIPLNDFEFYLSDFKNKFLVILEKTYPYPYEKFIKKLNEEIWLKKAEMYILTNKKNINLIRDLSREYFSGIEKGVSFRNIDEGNMAVKLILLFDRLSDYSISEKKRYSIMDTRIEMTARKTRSKGFEDTKYQPITMEEIYNPYDKYTRIAVEEVHTKDFKTVFEYLDKGMHGLIGDLHLIESKNVRSEKKKFEKKTREYYRKAGIEGDFSYLNNSSEGIILKTLKINGWWRNSFKLYLKAREIQKEIDWERTTGEKEKTKMDRKLRRKYYLLRSRRNINDFNRVMGDFYKSLISETQKECKDFTKRVLGYAF